MIPQGEPSALPTLTVNARPPSAPTGDTPSLSRGTPIPGTLLTTAADLLNGTSKPVEFPQVFTVGMTVRHPQRGLGRVTKADGTGKWRTVTVEFETGDPAVFVAHKCPLQPVAAG